MKLNEIQDLIKFVAKSGVSEVEVETKDIKIIIKTPASKNKEQIFVQTTAQPQMQAPVIHQEVAPTTETKAPELKASSGDDESKYIIVKSPMIGTFYRSSAPDKPLFVNVGDEIAPGKVTCIIEAMKLFNEIESEIKGKIVKVLANDATPVEYDQPLFLVD
ncbi:MAG: acetyl-CoA carboxylase biotin carboxyl carrier protein, partial [Bacteroidetes bacterium]|nr:acetyl-CoA carboxylase biotin carboxyl carrier protein [Bacteroidota bacterium]